MQKKTNCVSGSALPGGKAGAVVVARWVSLALGVMLLSGCHGPLSFTQAGTGVTVHLRGQQLRGSGLRRDGIVKQVALFLPNRVADLLDVVKLGLGINVGLGVDVRVTQWCQLAAEASVGVGLQWDGRDHNPGIANAQATAAFGPWRGGVGKGTVASIKPFEVALATGGLKFGVDFAEAADFVLGWFFIDFQQDDYGWKR